MKGSAGGMGRLGSKRWAWAALTKRGGVLEIWGYRELIGRLVQRELGSRYKRSVLGWLWSMLNPAATLAIYALVFGVLLKFDPPRAGNGRFDNFALYLFCALVMWNAFYGVITGAMSALLDLGSLLGKVYFPPEAPAVAALFTVLFQAAIEASILMLILICLVNVSWTFLLWPVLLVFLSIFALGIGLMLSVWNVRYRDVGYLSTIALQFLFYVTPIVYPLSLIPERAMGLPVRDIIRLNPLSQFTEASRELLYGLDWPGVLRLGLMALISLAVGAGGWLMFKVRTRDIAEEL
ncbi:ABC transporter permease [Candidatus Poriferisocius sp.]|uniref:ABC transporter permease n=1 Tax=Candidatus Poriferisocius sp. TaxID=3101276 RepID=UPI003B5BB5C9